MSHTWVMSHVKEACHMWSVISCGVSLDITALYGSQFPLLKYKISANASLCCHHCNWRKPQDIMRCNTLQYAATNCNTTNTVHDFADVTASDRNQVHMPWVWFAHCFYYDSRTVSQAQSTISTPEHPWADTSSRSVHFPCTCKKNAAAQCRLPKFWPLSLFFGWRIPNLITGLSGWCASDESCRIQETVSDRCRPSCEDDRLVGKNNSQYLWADMHPRDNKFQQLESSLHSYR